MFIGLDLGTSALKALLVDEDARVVGTASVPLTVLRPRPGWSEQDPQDWREAALAVVDELASSHSAEIAAVRGIGLSGQMHGADRHDSFQLVRLVFFPRPAVHPDFVAQSAGLCFANRLKNGLGARPVSAVRIRHFPRHIYLRRP